MTTEEKLAAKIIKNKDKYYCWAVRPATIQRINLLSASWYKHLGTDTINFRGTGDDICYYFNRDKYQKASLDLNRHFNSSVFVKKHLQNYRSASKRLLAVGEKALHIKSDRVQLLHLLISYQSALIDYALYFITTFSVDDYVFPALVADLKKEIKPESYDKAIKIISSPTMVFGYQKYQQALVKARTVNDFERLAKKFRWIKEYSFQEKLLDANMARDDKKQLIREGLENNITRANIEVRYNKKQLAVLLKTIKDKRLRMRAGLVNDYINIKTERIENYKIFQTNFRNFFAKLLVLVKQIYPLARYEDMVSLTDQEIVSFLKIGQGIDLNLTGKRWTKEYVAFSINGQTKFIYNKKLVNKIRVAFLSVKPVQEIKGNIVSRGQARGKVKIVLSQSDLKKIKLGDILVSNFTTPEYIPAMKKAAAIITDDGGITCHAAIIARELGKPCIVGTKIATSVLHDGDLVKLDAGRGIVRIVKK